MAAERGDVERGDDDRVLGGVFVLERDAVGLGGGCGGRSRGGGAGGAGLAAMLVLPESSLRPRFPSVERDGVGFKTSRRNWRMLADLVFFPLRSMVGYVDYCSEAICEKDVEALGLRSVGC